MRTDAYHFDLPDHLIAQHPVAARSTSRLLVVNREKRTLSHHFFSEIPALIPAKLHFFRNNVSVLRARLKAQRPTGGGVECVLLQPSDSRPLQWTCLVKPGRKLPVGAHFQLLGMFEAKIVSKDSESGTSEVLFSLEKHTSVVDMAEACGELPLPPYIKRPEPSSADNERYQTVYADPEKRIAAAAPTAGLHFTETVLNELSEAGHQFHDLSLRVGLGTFRPVKTENIEDHAIHKERYWIPASSLDALHSAQGRRIAVGTTSVRSIEDCLSHIASDHPPNCEYSREADLFVIPPYEFRGVDHLITNFHLPKSTLFGLVAAFLTPGSIDGVDWLKEIYQEAIQEEYRFFSYGDAMLIL